MTLNGCIETFPKAFASKFGFEKSLSNLINNLSEAGFGKTFNAKASFTSNTSVNSGQKAIAPIGPPSVPADADWVEVP